MANDSNSKLILEFRPAVENETLATFKSSRSRVYRVIWDVRPDAMEFVGGFFAGTGSPLEVTKFYPPATTGSYFKIEVALP